MKLNQFPKLFLMVLFGGLIAISCGQKETAQEEEARLSIDGSKALLWRMLRLLRCSALQFC